MQYLVEGRMEAGLDEAGRGCLAGPVVAAAVILPPGFSHPMLNDSKQLSRKIRDSLRLVIEKEALAWAVGTATSREIDEINILNATFLAMNRAVETLTVTPGHLLVDGNRFRNMSGIPHTCIVRGDAKICSIAAASILAKTHRDEMMSELHGRYPVYGWSNNNGYPTLFHREAIRKNGVSPFHRLSFRLTNEQLTLWK
jgi:ribonuclease HII